MRNLFWIMEHKEITLSLRNSVGSDCRRLWGIAASYVTLYILDTFRTDHIRACSKIGGPFVLPDTVIPMFLFAQYIYKYEKMYSSLHSVVSLIQCRCRCTICWKSWGENDEKVLLHLRSVFLWKDWEGAPSFEQHVLPQWLIVSRLYLQNLGLLKVKHGYNHLSNGPEDHLTAFCHMPSLL